MGSRSEVGGEEALCIHASSWSTIFLVGHASGKPGKRNELFPSDVKGNGDAGARPRILHLAVCSRNSLLPCLKVGAGPGAGAGTVGPAPAGWESIRPDGREVYRLGELVVKTWACWAWPPIKRSGLLKSGRYTI